MFAHNERIIVEACHVKQDLWELAEARAAYGLVPPDASDWRARDELAQALLGGEREWSQALLDEWLVTHPRPPPRFMRCPRLPKKKKRTNRKVDPALEKKAANADEGDAAASLGLLEPVIALEEPVEE